MLDAAEAVVRRDGAAHLTLDAVAAEAGISKASVLYELGTKRALIAAVIERRMGEWTERCGALEGALEGQANAPVHALVAMCAVPIPEEERDAAVALSTALFQDETLRQPIQKDLSERIETILRHSETPTGALCALLAVEGLLTLENFDLHHFRPELRTRLVAAIGWIADHEPGGREPLAGDDDEGGRSCFGARAPRGGDDRE